MKKNVFVLLLAISIYGLFSLATSKYDDGGEFFKCYNYVLYDTLFKIDSGNVLLYKQHNEDTIIFRVKDTTKLNNTANLICTTLKNNCNIKNTTLLFYDNSISVYDSLLFVNGKRIKTLKCN